ncbi:unnamed protein product, partial [Rotaria sordida]
TFFFINNSLTTSLTPTKLLNMEDNMKILESMGFTGRELNRKVLTRAKNDIREAVTLLTSSHLFNDDFMTSNEHRPTSTFGSLTEKQMKRQQNVKLRF